MSRLLHATSSREVGAALLVPPVLRGGDFRTPASVAERSLADVDEALRDEVKNMLRVESGRLVRQALLRDFRPARHGCPILFVKCARDAVVPPAAVDKQMAVYRKRGRTVEAVDLPDLGHIAVLGEGATLIAGHVDHWISTAQARSAT